MTQQDAEIVARLRSEQNFNLAMIAGIGAAVGGAVLWAVVTVVTKMELGLMAIAVGYLVGRAIRETGKGIDAKFGYLGAACGLLGCVLGNMLSALAFYADHQHATLAGVLGNMDLNLLLRLMTGFFQPMDLLFYGIGIYEGYRFSFKYRLATSASVAPHAQS
jgi:hypothetical protein